jgi:glycosyltransferase involved in cell wall biosynthesis
MKIGIDIRVLAGRRTGIGRLVKEILVGLAKVDKENEYILLHNIAKGPLPADIPVQPNFRATTIYFPNRALNILWAYTQFPKVEKYTGPLDVFHGPNFQMPPTKNCATILTIYDLTFMLYPEMAIPASVRHYGPRIREYIRRADIITTISDATADDIVKHLQVPRERIVTIYPGAIPLRCPSKDAITDVRKIYGIRENYILFVGCIEPRKNLVRLSKAFDESKLSKDFELILAGPKGWHTDDIFATRDSLSCREKIHWINYVEDNHLGLLYAGATFLAYPSILEGFGLPILEAFSVGCPVLTSNISSMPEAGGDAALYVDPFDIDSISEGLIKLASDGVLRQKLTQLGYKQAANFTWDKTASQTIEAYKKACELAQSRKRAK